MLESEKFAIAAHLHVQLRRKTGRVTDVEWMVRSPEYAHEVIRLALAEADAPELQRWALRLQEVLFGAGPAERGNGLPARGGRGAPAPAAAPAEAQAADGVRRYLGRLR